MQEEKIKSQIQEQDKTGRPKKRIIIPFLIVVIGIVAGVNFYHKAITYVSTDDAFIEGHIVQISPKVSGTVSKVYIDDNQSVNKGQLLVELEAADYDVVCEQAKAKLESALAKQKGASVNVGLTSITSESNSGQANAVLEQANHNVAAARAELALAQTDYDRYSKLYDKGIVSKQDYDKSSTKYKVAQESLSSALKAMEQALQKSRGSNTVDKQVSISDSALKSANAEIKQLQAAYKQAKLNLSYTKIYAPESGTITGKSVEAGAYVYTGQPFFTIVPSDRWIIANFKETQLTHMKKGQPVSIKIDTYPNEKFKGVVESIQTSTGAKSSLFPPENAVGSFVKVVQRVPVKITFSEKPAGKFIIVPGMSVIPEVKIK